MTIALADASAAAPPEDSPAILQGPAAARRRPVARLVGVLVLAGALGFLGATPFFAELISGIAAQSHKPLPRPLAVILVAQGLQLFLFVALSAWTGARLAPRLGLDAPFFRSLAERTAWPGQSGALVLRCVGFGTAISAAVLLSLLALRPFVPAALWAASGTPHPWIGATSAFYGGICEELLLRWGVLTALFALLRKLGLQRAFWPANFASSLLFGLGHLPAVSALGLAFTPAVLAHVLLGNGLAGVALGWLFRRRGLEAAMVAHGTADLWLHAVAPLVLAA